MLDRYCHSIIALKRHSSDSASNLDRSMFVSTLDLPLAIRVAPRRV